MSSTKKMQVPGVGEVEFEQVPFEIKREEWNEYLVSSRGLKVRFRTTATRIWIARGDKKAPDGSPLILVESEQMAKSDDLLPEGLE